MPECRPFGNDAEMSSGVRQGVVVCALVVSGLEILRFGLARARCNRHESQAAKPS